MFKESLLRVKGLKDNIDALIQRLEDNIQDDLASEEDSPMKNLGKFRSQFNDIQNSKAAGQIKVLKEHDLSDVATLFKKLQAQFERFQSHYGINISKKTSLKDVESFKTKVEDLQKKAAHLAIHLKDKIRGGA